MRLPTAPNLPALGSPHRGHKLLQSRRPPAVARPGGTLQRIQGSPRPGRSVVSVPPSWRSTLSRQGRTRASNHIAGRNKRIIPTSRAPPKRNPGDFDDDRPERCVEAYHIEKDSPEP